MAELRSPPQQQLLPVGRSAGREFAQRLRKPEAVLGSSSASRAMVAENWGDSGRKRTCSTSCCRTVISVFSSGVRDPPSNACGS